MTIAAQHTAASLAQLHGRVLDVIAHEKVMRRHVTMWLHIPLDCGTDGIAGDPIPRYSADLNAAALLEKALSERGREAKRQYEYAISRIIGEHERETVGIAVFQFLTVSARDRTIAAVLAAQGEAK